MRRVGVAHGSRGVVVQSEHFAFLNGPNSGPFRTMFYASLSRLVFFEEGSERFEVGGGVWPCARVVPCVCDALCCSVCLSGSVWLRVASCGFVFRWHRVFLWGVSSLTR